MLEGSIRRAGGRLRIAMQLIEGGGSGLNLWARTFEGERTSPSWLETALSAPHPAS